MTKPEPLPKVNVPAYPDIEFCSRCHDNAVFTLDFDETEWLSECCGARAIEPDVEPDDLGEFENDQA